MNYPNPNDNPARQALTRAVDRAIANGSPVLVNVPARASSVDKVIACDTSTSNWCNVLGVLDAAADYIGAYDSKAYELLCTHIEVFPLKLQWRAEANALDQLARIERYLIADGCQAGRAYGHGNDAAGPELRGLWDACQIVNGIRTAWIESLK